MLSIAEDDNLNTSLEFHRYRLSATILDFIVHMEGMITELRDAYVRAKITQSQVHRPVQFPIYRQPFRDYTSEARAPSFANNGTVSEDVEIGGNQDLFPPRYLHDALPLSGFRVQNDYHNSDRDIPPQIYTANNQWISDKAIPSMYGQYSNPVPLPRGLGSRFPWTSRKERRTTDASQAHRVYGSRDPIEHRFRHQKALLIGIQYQNIEPEHRRLMIPWQDVELMKNLLIDIYHYKVEDIVIMTDEPNTPKHLQPERENILREITNLVQDLSAGDDLFFYYAGHAIQLKERIQGNERDHLDECLVPVDALDDESLVIVDDELHSMLVQPLIQADVDCQLIAIMDTCTSGTLLDLKHDICNSIHLGKISWEKILTRFAPSLKSGIDSGSLPFCNGFCSEEGENHKATIICISACKDSQTIVESSRGGTLARVLDNFLRNHKRPSLGELFPYMRGTIKATHKLLLAVEAKKLKNNERQIDRIQSHRRLPKRSPSPQISSMRPLKAKMPFRPSRVNSGCH